MKKHTRNKETRVRDLFESINKATKILKESYSFAEEFDDEEPMETEEQPMEDTSMSDENIINQIRDIALEGIQAHKDTVDDGYYMFYKSIWEDVDKFVSKANKEQEEK